ncbi:MAG: glycosyltransferase, partial [Prochloraceae cyanobacterium]
NADSLAWGILEILKNPAYARCLTDRAFASLKERFDWAKIARSTEKVYDKITKERLHHNYF